MSINNIIKGVPLFHDLHESEIDEVVANCFVMQLKPGEKVFNEGDLAYDLYLILSGKIDIIKNSILIASLCKADIFGELILLFEGTRSTDAIAVAHSDLLVLNYNSILQMYDKNPRALCIIMQNVSRLLAARLKKSNAEITELKREQNLQKN